MELQIGDVVISTMGRDKGLYFIVVETTKNYVYLVDGAVRKIDNPKKKKVKHIELTSMHDENIEARVKNKHKITNQDIKKALREMQREI